MDLRAMSARKEPVTHVVVINVLIAADYTSVVVLYPCEATDYAFAAA
jgi:hypothetical protein